MHSRPCLRERERERAVPLQHGVPRVLCCVLCPGLCCGICVRAAVCVYVCNVVCVQ